MTNILYITNQICGPGGLERVLSVKASYLAEKLAYNVHILTLNQGKQPLFYNFSAKIKYHDITVGGNPISYIKQYKNGIKDIVAKVKPEIILVCDDGLKGFFTPLLVGKPCPMIYERHVSKLIELKHRKETGFLGNVITKLKFGLMNFAGSYYDKFVVLTDGNKKEWNFKNLTVISNPLPFYPNRVATLNSKKVLAVGKLSEQKGFDLLLKSWKIVSEIYPDWSLHIFGKGNDYKMLTAYAEANGISESIAIHPPSKEIIKEYQDASLYVLSSRFEGFGMVLIEAMACGVPCVSFDCPFGPSDIITDTEDGYMVANGDIEGLSDRIKELIGNDELRREMGVKARENVTRYLPEQIVSKWDKMFKELIIKP